VVDLGRGVRDGRLFRGAVVAAPLKTLNRHRLIARATDTGKTRVLQLLAEQLSAQGVSVFAADYKKEPSDALTDDLGSREGKALQREVVRAVFSLLRKKL
jgi:Helicase HerA-like C-terminal